MSPLAAPAQRAAIAITYEDVHASDAHRIDGGVIVDHSQIPMGCALLRVIDDPWRERYLVVVTHPGLAPVEPGTEPPIRTLDELIDIVQAWEAAIGTITDDEVLTDAIAGNGPLEQAAVRPAGTVKPDLELPLDEARARAATIADAERAQLAAEQASAADPLTQVTAPELLGSAGRGHATSATPGAEVAGRVPPLTSSPEEDSYRPAGEPLEVIYGVSVYGDPTVPPGEVRLTTVDGNVIARVYAVDGEAALLPRTRAELEARLGDLPAEA